MDLNERKLLKNKCLTALFNDFPLIWMLNNQELNDKINKLHERSLFLLKLTVKLHLKRF